MQVELRCIRAPRTQRSESVHTQTQYAESSIKTLQLLYHYEIRRRTRWRSEYGERTPGRRADYSHITSIRSDYLWCFCAKKMKKLRQNTAWIKWRLWETQNSTEFRVTFIWNLMKIIGPAMIIPVPACAGCSEAGGLLVQILKCENLLGDLTEFVRIV